MAKDEMSFKPSGNPDAPKVRGTPFAPGAKPGPGRPRKTPEAASSVPNANAASAPNSASPPAAAQSSAATATLQADGVNVGNASDKPRRKETSTSAPQPGTPLTKEQKAGLAQQIEGLHQMMALMLGIPEMVIAPAEAQALAEGVAAVSREFGTVINPKTAAILQLTAAAGMVYAPRVIKVAGRVSAAKKQRLEAAKQKVSPIRPGVSVSDTPTVVGGQVTMTDNNGNVIQ